MKPSSAHTLAVALAVTGVLASSAPARPLGSPIKVVLVRALGSRVTLVQNPNATLPAQHPSAGGLLTPAPNELNVVTGGRRYESPEADREQTGARAFF